MMIHIDDLTIETVSTMRAMETKKISLDTSKDWPYFLCWLEGDEEEGKALCQGRDCKDAVHTVFAPYCYYEDDDYMTRRVRIIFAKDGKKVRRFECITQEMPVCSIQEISDDN